MTYNDFLKPLMQVYDAAEAKAVARLALEQCFGLLLTDIVCGKVERLDEQSLLSLRERLCQGEPVQYVLGKADFGSRTFHVEPGVLIPRPETYELCQWIVSTSAFGPSTFSILDIGTGSGCIACTLAAEMPQAAVTAWDISDKALSVARDNAKRTNVFVTFEHQDALCLPDDLDRWDVVVSNPPYVCWQERATMARNVLDFEPELALFVPDADPLLFYRHIASYARQALKDGGRLYFEINPLYVDALKDLLSGMGFQRLEVRSDQFGKQRFISVCKRNVK